MKRTILLLMWVSFISCTTKEETKIIDLYKLNKPTEQPAPSEKPNPSEPEEELPALTSFPLRVNIQSEYATPEKIIDNE